MLSVIVDNTAGFAHPQSDRLELHDAVLISSPAREHRPGLVLPEGPTGTSEGGLRWAASR